MSCAASPATRLLAAARSCNLHRPHSHRLCRIGSQVWPCPLIAASAAMPRVLDGGHGPHQAAARCVGTSRTDLGIAIVLVCSALRAGWSAGAATRCLKVTVYAFYATGARSNSSATRPDILLYLTLKEVFWYELPRTLRGLAVGVRRLYLPSGVMNQVSDTKNRVVKA